MCGIVAYSGQLAAVKILIQGLKKLEYRGYDSAGITLLSTLGMMERYREVGKIKELEKSTLSASQAQTGIAHTRWATHGKPTQNNAHPHHSQNDKFAVVHNGIIENYATIRKDLETKGYEFQSDTDTECIAHLLQECDTGNLLHTLQIILPKLSGTYGLAVLSKDQPTQIVATRSGSPLVFGICGHGFLLASDVAALVSHTQSVLYLDEGDILCFDDQGYEIFSKDSTPVQRSIEEVTFDEKEVMLSGFQHFMQKEIFEQAQSLQNSMRGRIHLADGNAKLQGLELHYRDLRHVDRIILTACGTSYYAAMAGEYLLEELTGIPVEVELASEFRYRNPILNPNTLVFCISQSGETADTLAALREAKRKGSTVLGICNVVGSSIARESDGGVYLHAGPEIGVASTKAFSSQWMVLALIALLLGRQRRLSFGFGEDFTLRIQEIPQLIPQVLGIEAVIQKFARTIPDYKTILYLGRGILYPTALEGALKLKETSYLNANAYSLAELKHGPLALVDEETLSVILIPNNELRDKVRSGIMEVKSRGSKIVLVGHDLAEFNDLGDQFFEIPQAHPMLEGILQNVVLQLLAYHCAVALNCDVDQPRNLAKSVTVE